MNIDFKNDGTVPVLVKIREKDLKDVFSFTVKFNNIVNKHDLKDLSTIDRKTPAIQALVNIGLMYSDKFLDDMERSASSKTLNIAAVDSSTKDPFKKPETVAGKIKGKSRTSRPTKGDSAIRKILKRK